jgi:hypothetical protein
MAYHPGNVGVVMVALGHPHVVKKFSLRQDPIAFDIPNPLFCIY